MGQISVEISQPTGSLLSGNQHWLITPTNVAMGDLDPAQLCVLDADGGWVDGPQPTKEVFLHAATAALEAEIVLRRCDL